MAKTPAGPPKPRVTLSLVALAVDKKDHKVRTSVTVEVDGNPAAKIVILKQDDVAWLGGRIQTDATTGEAEYEYVFSKDAANSGKLSAMAGGVESNAIGPFEFDPPESTSKTKVEKLVAEPTKIGEGHYYFNFSLFNNEDAGIPGRLRFTGKGQFKFNGVKQTKPFEIDVPKEGIVAELQINQERLEIDVNALGVNRHWQLQLIGPDKKPIKAKATDSAYRHMIDDWK